MDTDVLDECRRLLLHKVQQYDRYNAERIMDFIAAHIPLEGIRWYSSSTSDQQIRLFDQASAALELLPPQQPPSRGQGVGLQFSQPQPQFHPINSSQRFQPHLPHSQLQFGPSDSFGNQVPFPGSNGSFGGNQAPFRLPHPEPQFYPIEFFQSSFPGFSGSRGHLQPQSIPGDGMQSSSNAHQSFTGYPPSSSNAQNKPCKYFNWGRCRKGGDCLFPHVSSGFYMRKKMSVHSLETLHELDSEINSLLSVQKSPLPIEHLPQVFFQKYGESLLVNGFQQGGQEQGKESYSLRFLLKQLKTIEVIERDGQHYVVSVADACGVGKAADDSKLVLSPPSCGASNIFISFYSYGIFTAKDVFNYFCKYGPVNHVQIPTEGTFGFVNFVYPETVKLILSENSERTHHYIRGQEVKVYPYKEKHERQKQAQRDAQSNSRAHVASDVMYEHQRSNNTVESPNVSNRLNNTSADEDIDEYGLPHSLGI